MTTQTSMCTGSGLFHVLDGLSLLWSRCSMDFCNVANHGSAVELMDATMGCETPMTQRFSTSAGRFAPMMSSSIATSSARFVLEIISMLSYRGLKQLALHTIQCGWWKQLCGIGRINLLLNVMYKPWLLLTLWCTPSMQSVMWNGLNVFKLYLLKKFFLLYLMMAICLMDMNLLYLKLLNMAMMSLNKNDKNGMSNCSTTTVQQDIHQIGTWFTFSVMLGLPKWKIEMARDFRCDACDRLLQGSKSSGEVPRATTHPLCKAWEIVGADSSEWHVPDQKIKIKFILLIDFATKLRAVGVCGEIVWADANVVRKLWRCHQSDCWKMVGR